MTVVECLATPRGELILRKDGDNYEVVSNGVFLMDTRDGRSERLLVSAALDAHPAPRTLLIGGLGVGFSLAEAIRDHRLERITVVEIEAALLRWYEGPLGGVAHRDPRVTVAIGDIVDHTGSYDVICLDVDNGPDWTVSDANTRLYDDTGTQSLRDRLTPGGVLGVWSSHAVPAYEATLRAHFVDVQVHTVPVSRGEPDVVYVARSG